MGKRLSEKDLEKIFYCGQKNYHKHRIKKLLNFFIFFLLISALVYLIINFNSLFNNLSFWYQYDYNTTTDTDSDTKIILPKDVKNIENKISFPEINNNSISMPDIEVNAPVIWNVPDSQSTILDNLKRGIVHLEGMSLPGQIGNVFITGHSSNYPWVKSQYNDVFSLLNKLVVGNLIQIKYQDKNYIYRVSEIKVVKPNDLSVLKQSNKSILTVMTCSPVGTSLNRLIVIANQVYPDPAKNQKSQTSGANFLPHIR